MIGYPNVGKSSIINTLVSKKSCKTAPVPGETKIWQYVTLFKRISLIDCPGVVVDTAGDTEEDSVLKGVVRAERLEHPEDFVSAIQKRVKREHIAAQYKIPVDGWPDIDDGDNTNDNNSSIVLMDLIARKGGRLKKGGDPCRRTAAITLINDFQRGRLPHFVPPPELKTEPSDIAIGKTTNYSVNSLPDIKHEVLLVEQNLDNIGEETMNSKSNIDEKDDGSHDSDEMDSKMVADLDGNEHRTVNQDLLPTVQTATNFIGECDWDD